MNPKSAFGRVAVWMTILNLLCSITGVLIASATPGEATNSNALTHAVLAEEATATW